MMIKNYIISYLLLLLSPVQKATTLFCDNDLGKDILYSSLNRQLPFGTYSRRVKCIKLNKEQFDYKLNTVATITFMKRTTRFNRENINNEINFLFTFLFLIHVRLHWMLLCMSNTTIK